MYILKFKHTHFTPDGKEWYETCTDSVETLDFLIGSLEDSPMISCWMIEGHTAKSLGLNTFNISKKEYQPD